MDKIPKQVAKDPKKEERGKKSQEAYTKILKEDIKKDNQLSTSSPQSSTSSSTDKITLHFFLFFSR